MSDNLGAIDTSNLAEAGRIIRRVAREAKYGLIAFTDHALEEMEKDDLDRLHILSMLKACKVVSLNVDNRYGETRYRAVGRVEENEAAAAVTIALVQDEFWALRVITAWKV